MTPLNSTSYPSCFDSINRDEFGYPIEGQEVDDVSPHSHSDSAVGDDVYKGTIDSIPRDAQGYPIGTQSSESGLSDSSSALGYSADEGDTNESSSPLSSDLVLGSKTTFSSNSPSSSISDSFMSSEEVQSSSTSGSSIDSPTLEGPKGYEMPNPGLYQSKKAFVSLNILSTSPIAFESYFYRGVRTPHTDCWAVEAEAALANHFGLMSVKPLGMGSNSGVFVLEQKDSGKKHVLRVFSVEGLSNPNYAKNYRLDKSRVGGEWLSIVMDHPNVASSSHLLVWDSSNGFRVLNREQALTLINSHDQLLEGQEIYAVGTVGDLIEGSVDLEEALKSHRFSQQETKVILTDLFEGMEAVHEQDICHRDLKPSNILILPSGRAQVIDFGTATRESQSLRMSRGGDFTYHPAENILSSNKRSGKKADSYGLFRISYHLVTGKDFFEGIQNVSSGQMRFSEISRRHCQILSREVEGGFTQILAEEPNLRETEPELIELMSVTGTNIVSKRSLPKAALQMPYFRGREVKVA